MFCTAPRSGDPGCVGVEGVGTIRSLLPLIVDLVYVDESPQTISQETMATLQVELNELMMTN